MLDPYLSELLRKSEEIIDKKNLKYLGECPLFTQLGCSCGLDFLAFRAWKFLLAILLTMWIIASFLQIGPKAFSLLSTVLFICQHILSYFTPNGHVIYYPFPVHGCHYLSITSIFFSGKHPSQYIFPGICKLMELAHKMASLCFLYHGKFPQS